MNGLKRHENVIDALGIVLFSRRDLVGMFVGGQWGKGTSYEKRLQNVPLIWLESALNLPDGFLHLKRLEPGPVLIVQCMYLIPRIVGVLSSLCI